MIICRSENLGDACGYYLCSLIFSPNTSKGAAVLSGSIYIIVLAHNNYMV